MADWTSGYVTDVSYTFGYYPELNPLRARPSSDMSTRGPRVNETLSLSGSAVTSPEMVVFGRMIQDALPPR